MLRQLGKTGRVSEGPDTKAEVTSGFVSTSSTNLGMECSLSLSKGSLPGEHRNELGKVLGTRRQHLTDAVLADRLGLNESAVQKLVDPDHRSHISHAMKALRAVGRNLVTEDRAA